MRDPGHVWTHAEQLTLCLSLGGPLASPGTRLSYSDTGYLILGDVMEAVTGEPLPVTKAAGDQVIGEERFKFTPGAEPRPAGAVDLTPSVEIGAGSGTVIVSSGPKEFAAFADFSPRLRGNPALVEQSYTRLDVNRDGAVSQRPSVNVAQSEIVGSVGAGDAFYAGVLFGLHEDWSLQRCLDLGNAAAAMSSRAKAD